MNVIRNMIGVRNGIHVLYSCSSLARLHYSKPRHRYIRQQNVFVLLQHGISHRLPNVVSIDTRPPIEKTSKTNATLILCGMTSAHWLSGCLKNKCYSWEPQGPSL